MNFLLGVGAQKTATTWLFDALNTHDDVRLSPLKEVHFFDSHFRPFVFKAFNDRAIAKMDEIVRQSEGRTRKLRQAFIKPHLDRYCMVFDPVAYGRHFRDMIEPGVNLVGEITPSYALLNDDEMREAKAMIEAAGFTPKVVFIMRDPAARLISAYQMNMVRGRLNSEKTLEEFMLQKMQMDRGRYDLTVQALDAAFPQEQIQYLFFENLFTQDSYDGICNFLGCSRGTPDFGKRVNKSSAKVAEPDESYALAVAHHEEVYAFCRDRFGADIPASWAL